MYRTRFVASVYTEVDLFRAHREMHTRSHTQTKTRTHTPGEKHKEEGQISFGMREHRPAHWIPNHNTHTLTGWSCMLLAVPAASARIQRSLYNKISFHYIIPAPFFTSDRYGTLRGFYHRFTLNVRPAHTSDAAIGSSAFKMVSTKMNK